MARIWTVPKTWKYKEIATATSLNQELRDNLEWLKFKPRNYAPLIGTADDAPSLVTTGWTAVNDLKWSVSVDTVEVDEEVFLYFRAGVKLVTAAQQLGMDVLIDSTVYASSMTATPVTNGMYMIYILSAGIDYPAQFRCRVVIPTPGTHTFKLRAKVMATNSVATFVTVNKLAEFGVQVE